MAKPRNHFRLFTVQTKQPRFVRSPNVLSSYITDRNSHNSLLQCKISTAAQQYKRTIAGWMLFNLQCITFEDSQLYMERDCAQRAQTSTKASNLNQKWSAIRIKISRLIRIWIWMSASSSPKWRFITLSVSVISPSVGRIHRWLYEKC